MKHWLAVCFLLGATASLAGCYYDPGYSYVRSTPYVGDAYYGRSAPVYDDYYAPGYDAYYDGYYGCCYAPGVSIGISDGWYGGRHHYRGWRGDHDHDHDYHGGGYHGHGGHHDHDDYHGHDGHDPHWERHASEGHGHLRSGAHDGDRGGHHRH